MTVASRAIAMAHAIDPKAEILARVGEHLKGVRIAHNHILVATYVRPEKTKGGIILTGTSRDEDKYQGKVGLVLAKGPLAFVDDKDTKFMGQDVEPGDWVFYRAPDGMQMLLGEQHCRTILDTQVRGWLTHPDVIL